MKQKIIQFLYGLYVTMWSLLGVGPITLGIIGLCILHTEENAWMSVLMFFACVASIIFGACMIATLGECFQTCIDKQTVEEEHNES